MSKKEEKPKKGKAKEAPAEEQKGGKKTAKNAKIANYFPREQNDTTFGTVDDFQNFTTLPVIGVIPTVGATRKGKKKIRAAGPIITLSEPDSVAAEHAQPHGNALSGFALVTHITRQYHVHL